MHRQSTSHALVNGHIQCVFRVRTKNTNSDIPLVIFKIVVVAIHTPLDHYENRI